MENKKTITHQELGKMIMKPYKKEYKKWLKEQKKGKK